MTYLGHPAHQLGPVQKHVLLVLSTRGTCARNDWAAWYPIRPEQTYSAIDGLARRGLVDVAGFATKRNARTFKLTAAGEAVVMFLCDDDMIEEA